MGSLAWKFMGVGVFGVFMTMTLLFAPTSIDHVSSFSRQLIDIGCEKEGACTMTVSDSASNGTSTLLVSNSVNGRYASFTLSAELEGYWHRIVLRRYTDRKLIGRWIIPGRSKIQELIIAAKDFHCDKAPCYLELRKESFSFGEI
jgi:hypothetical protein